MGSGGGIFLVVVLCPVELGSLELTGAQPNCLGFSSLMSMFWSFLKGMHWEETFTFMYACIGRKPFTILIVLSLLRWVGFAHFEVGVGCKYLSLAQWIKDASYPVDVTVCLTRWVNYCTFKTERKKKQMQKLHTLSETGMCLVVIGCFAYAGGIQCTVRNCFYLTKITCWKKKRHFSNTTFPAIISSGSSLSLGMPVVP